MGRSLSLQLLLCAALAGGMVTRAPIRRRHGVPLAGAFVLGLNQYSHDAGAALLSLDGREAFVVPKERLSRLKCDGGGVGSAVAAVLADAHAKPADIALVVANNHHFRLDEFESALPWRVALGLQPDDCLDPLNLLPGIEKRELSHHLAHAWSVIASAPFNEGLIVIMDGMGEAADAVAIADLSADEAYVHDSCVPSDDEFGFEQIPSTLAKHLRYREAESVYMLRRDATTGDPQLTKIFKRWVAHLSPPELYNHGFESMESLGALYSRCACT